MRIPWQQIKPEVLTQLLEEIVTRDGTDYGSEEISVDEKVNNVLRSLKDGDAVLGWDVELATANLLRADELATDSIGGNGCLLYTSPSPRDS